MDEEISDVKVKLIEVMNIWPVIPYIGPKVMK